MPSIKEPTPHDITHKKDLVLGSAQSILSAADAFLPLIVASKDIEKVILGFSPKTAANLRSQKKGPRYFMVGGTPYYKTSDLLEYFCSNPVETFNS
jgi:hypothetical protein